MKPFERSYDIFALICICPTDRSANKWIKFRNIAFSFMAFLFMFTTQIGSYTFIIKYIKTDLVRAIFAVLQAAALTETVYTIITAYLLRNEIQSIFVAFQTFYDSGIYFTK